MQLRTLLKRTRVSGKKVLVRVDINVPIHHGKVDPKGKLRLASIIPTINHLRKKRAKVILVGHLGRPSGKRLKRCSLFPVSSELSLLIKQKILFLNETVGTHTEKIVSDMKDGDIALLENVRFYKGEIENDTAFALKLSRLGDIYINEAFGDSHRTHASTVGITKFLTSFAGFLLTKELTTLTALQKKPKRPLLFIIGGSKLISKLIALLGISPFADTVLIGGAIANPFIHNSIFKRLNPKEHTQVIKIKNELSSWNNVVFPSDIKIIRKGRVREIDTSQYLPKDTIIDIGSHTVMMYKKFINNARTIVWNGPLGVFETKEGNVASTKIARILSKTRAYTYVGGGETTELISQLRLTSQFTFISTGGGAMLYLLSGGTLPGIKALMR